MNKCKNNEIKEHKKQLLFYISIMKMLIRKKSGKNTIHNSPPNKNKNK
jgi:hypothetical protein